MLIVISLQAYVSPPEGVIRARTMALATELVDGLGNVGHMNSIAVDSYDNIHISYYDYTNLDLKYATNANGSWYTSTIDSEGIVGSGSSIAVDSSDKVHISYLNYTDLDLKYATNASGTWSTYTVASTGDVGKFTSIAIDSGGTVHISHFDDTDFDLEYTTNAGGSWTTYTVDSAGVGQFTSLAVDSADKIHISYEDLTNWDLKYATNAGGSWVTHTVDSIGIVGHGTSLFVDSHDYIHIGYYDYTNGDLKYATNSSGSWTTCTVDSAGDVGQSPSIAVDSSDRIFISYYDATNDDLKCAAKEGSSWTNYTVDSAGDVGQFTSLAVDSADNIHISYYDYTNGDLRYARIEGPGIEGPRSFVGSLAPFQTTSSFSVPYIASDLGGSGLAYVQLYYRLGTSGAFTLYTTGANPSGHWTSSPIEFDSSIAGGDGTYQFYTIAVDTIGNWEAAPSIPDATTTIDTVAPSTSIDVSGTAGLDGWHTSSVTITLESSDATSGVASTVYLIDDGAWETYSGSFSMSTEGVHILYWWANDNAGNQEPQQFVYVRVDTQAPETTVVVTGDTGANEWYIGESVDVELWFFEPTSYVTATVYRIDNGTWKTYSNGFSIDKEGTTVIDYYSADVAGNVEAQKSVSFKLDSTEPTLAITYPLADSKISRDSVTIEWSGADYVSEIDHYEIQIDGGNWIPMGTATSYELKGLQDKWYGVTVKAVDKSGNSATTTVGFGIYTSIWSENGPYNGIPLYAVIVAIIAAVILSVLLFWRKRKGGPTVASVPKG